jgi:predicted porin
MKALKKMFAAALAAALPLAGLAADEPAKPAENAPAATPAPAPAPLKPTVTLYGTFNVNYQTTKAGGATTASQSVAARNAISIDSSNIGVRGTLEFSPLLGAVYQCEMSAAVDGSGTNSLCNRNSRLGLTGTWGTLFYGNWDTPYKASHYGTKADDPFQTIDVWESASILTSPGFATKTGGWVNGAPTDASTTAAPTNVSASFDNRAPNSIAYHSPKYYGASLKLQYSANEFRSAGGNVDPALYSGVVNWDYGPISALFAYERHDDGFGIAAIGGAKAPATGGTVANGPFGGPGVTSLGAVGAPHSSTDTAWRVGVGGELPSPAGVTTVGFIYEQLNYKMTKQAAGQLAEYERPAWQVTAKHRLGAHELRFRYSSADKGKYTLQGQAKTAANGFGATQYALGYAYYFNPSLQAYLHWTQISNEKNAQYTFGIGGATAVTAAPKGSNPQALGLGLKLTF